MGYWIDGLLEYWNIGLMGWYIPSLITINFFTSFANCTYNNLCALCELCVQYSLHHLRTLRAKMIDKTELKTYLCSRIKKSKFKKK